MIDVLRSPSRKRVVGPFSKLRVAENCKHLVRTHCRWCSSCKPDTSKIHRRCCICGAWFSHYQSYSPLTCGSSCYETLVKKRAKYGGHQRATHKRCAACLIVKEGHEFSSNHRQRDGLCSYCKSCATLKRRAFQVRHKEKRKAQKRAAYHASKCSPAFVLRKRMSRLIRKGLVNGKRGKSWRLLVDYSLEELKTHLERQFVSGMSWENFGTWHIDHIVPISSFSYSSPKDNDFKAAWSLANLRPCWARDNISKSNKRMFLL